jgi:hypothetical protein
MFMDSFQLYRCFVLYGRCWKIIILPSVLWIGILPCWLIQVIASHMEVGVGDAINYLASVLPIVLNLIISGGLFICHGKYKKMTSTPGLMVYRLRMISNEQDSVKHYEHASSTRNRVRFAARIVFETGSAYNLTFVVFSALQFIPAPLIANTCQLVGQSVRLTRSAKHWSWTI